MSRIFHITYYQIALLNFIQGDLDFSNDPTQEYRSVYIIGVERNRASDVLN